MSVKAKDFLERLGFTLALAAVSFGIVYLADIPDAWALAVLAVLQILKNLIAQQVGDPATSGFTNPEPQAKAAPQPDTDVQTQASAFMDEPHQQAISTDPGPGIPEPDRNIANPEGDF